MEPAETLINEFKRSVLSGVAPRNDLLYFINCDRIREGEYKGDFFVLKKIDSQKFIIYEETFQPEEKISHKQIRIIVRSAFCRISELMAVLTEGDAASS